MLPWFIPILNLIINPWMGGWMTWDMVFIVLSLFTSNMFRCIVDETNHKIVNYHWNIINAHNALHPPERVILFLHPYPLSQSPTQLHWSIWGWYVTKKGKRVVWLCWIERNILHLGMTLTQKLKQFAYKQMMVFLD